MAVAALKKEQVARIILTRPAVEAGEALGFLPGDLEQKISPYLRPLYDALREMLEPEELERAIARQTIEVAPLAYMRGRTLSNAFVILDEAQNTTTEQMFMLLTRIGLNSKCVVTGDVTQIDLPANKRSGVLEALQALKDVSGIAMVISPSVTSCDMNWFAPSSAPISAPSPAPPNLACKKKCSIFSNAGDS